MHFKHAMLDQSLIAAGHRHSAATDTAHRMPNGSATVASLPCPGSTPTTKIKANNPYLETIKHLDAVFDERLGTWQRTDPSHAPHFMQRHWVEQLHAALPDVFERTSASRFR